MEIHISDVRLFKRCRQLWDFAGRQRQGLRAKRPGVPLWFGTAVHAALDDYYLNGQVRSLQTCYRSWLKGELARLHSVLGDAGYREVRTQLATTAALGDAVLANYAAWAKRHDDFTTHATEREFKLPLARGLTLVGKLDAVVQRSGKWWVHEYKTTSAWWDPDYLFQDEQARAYVLAGQMLLPAPLGGIIYTFIMKRAPKSPRLLKSGALSVKGLNTSPELLAAAIHRLHLDPKDYGAALAAATAAEAAFVRRAEMQCPPQELLFWAGELAKVATEMQRPDVLIYPEPNPITCKSCEFREPCLEVCRGGNPSALLQTNYMLAARAEDVRLEE